MSESKATVLRARNPVRQKRSSTLCFVVRSNQVFGVAPDPKSVMLLFKSWNDGRHPFEVFSGGLWLLNIREVAETGP